MWCARLLGGRRDPSTKKDGRGLVGGGVRVGLKFADLNKRSAERQQMLEALQAALDKRIRVVNE
jgi:hypothetical protein